MNQPRENNFKAMGFSRRTAWDLAESPWANLLRQRRAAGMPLLDLTVSNPTRCGFDYDSKAILAPLGDPRAMDYDPDPRGMLRARQAVCQYYADHAAPVEAGQVLLTVSTSEAYSFLFRLLCDPGDEVLIAQPSYPLFDFLAALDDVRLISYPLFYDYGWHLDVEALRRRITPRTRAIVVVSPNNPTGHFTRDPERRELETICCEHGLALIVDEVFLDYPLPETSPVTFAAGDHPALTFVLSGLSKIGALPQMKAAWVVCLGPSAIQDEALGRLEVIGDTFLSVSAPVQIALPSWLAGRRGIQGQICERVRNNLAELDKQLVVHTQVTRLEVEAGWSVTLRFPAIEPASDTAFSLLDQRGIAVHSGDLFGFEPSGWLIISLLTPAKEFARGIEAICSYVNDLCVKCST